MTPQEAQRHAQALGYPWVAMDMDTQWHAYKEDPHTRTLDWGMYCGQYIHIPAPITYEGYWKDSKHGPEGVEQ